MIYVIGNEDGYVKIGITSGSIKNRLRTIQTGSSTKLRIIRAWELADKNTDRIGEKLLHSNLANHRVNGEWFSLPQKEMDWLLSRTENYFTHNEVDDFCVQSKIRKTRTLRLSAYVWDELARRAKALGLRGRAEYIEWYLRQTEIEKHEIPQIGNVAPPASPRKGP